MVRACCRVEFLPRSLPDPSVVENLVGCYQVHLVEDIQMMGKIERPAVWPRHLGWILAESGVDIDVRAFPSLEGWMDLINHVAKK